MQVDVAAVNNVVGIVNRVRVMNTLNPSVSQIKVLALNQSGKHLLFDGAHDEFDVNV